MSGGCEVQRLAVGFWAVLDTLGPYTLYMSAVRRHLGTIGGGWRAAWRGWRDNPLWVAWERSLAQREERSPWWRRSPGLTIFGALLALTATGVNIALLIDSLRYYSTGGGRPFISANLSLAFGVVLVSGGLFCLVWLCARLFRSVQFALGFLEREPKQKFRQTLDDMLAVSSLSEQELLAGCTWFSLRQVAWPLLGSCACLAIQAGRLLGSSAAGDAGALGVWSTLAHTLALFVMLSLSGLLATAALVLLCVAVSLAPRAGILPSVGAVSIVLMQPLFIAGGLLYASSTRDSLASEGLLLQAGKTLGLGMLFLLIVFLLFYLARRIEVIRMALAGALPLVLILPYALVGASLALTFDSDFGQALPLTQPLEVLTLLSPSLLTGYFATVDQSSAMTQAIVHWAAGLPLQLALIWIGAEMARDAVRRRKWGDAG